MKGLPATQEGASAMRESTWEVLSFVIPGLIGLVIILLTIFVR
jgi:hypothetical protein